MGNSVYDAGLNINTPLTMIAQGIKQPYLVMQWLYPLVETVNYTGQIPEFDDASWEEVNDDRADAAPYPEVTENVYGQAFELSTKGFKRKIGRKEADVTSAMGVDWGRRATRSLMRRAALRHEIEAANKATTYADYATTNRVSLSSGSQFSDSIDPLEAVFTAKSAIASQAGVDPNVAVLGREVFDALIRNSYIKQHVLGNPIAQAALMGGSANPAGITEKALATIFGLQDLKVCNAIQKTGTTKSRVFGKHMVLGYTNPEAIASLQQQSGDSMPRISYAVNRQITDEEPSLGYTLVKSGQPQVLGPFPNNEDQYVAYLLDFDRKIINTGVDRTSKKIIFGYMIQNAAA